ncbi:hypothetical protein Angca_000961 [Angiostrongylus cantonensis]|nr:hypothetical protein Angca_000961 [Angiostrongylus cantonensis]
MVTRVIVLLILPRLASTFYAYTPETFPDSIEQPIACNMHQASFLCDPSNVLSKGNLTANHILLSNSLIEVRESTRCTCSPMDVGQCDDSPRGFTISVAVVRKMVLDVMHSNLDSIRMAAEEFADALRERQNRGQCNDDVLIFVSVDDHVVKYFSTLIIPVFLVSVNVWETLPVSESYIQSSDYVEGILYMVESYATLLKGESLDLSTGYKWRIPLWLAITIGSGLVTLLLAMTIFLIYRCVVYCRGSRRAEYTMGTRV